MTEQNDPLNPLPQPSADALSAAQLTQANKPAAGSQPAAPAQPALVKQPAGGGGGGGERIAQVVLPRVSPAPSSFLEFSAHTITIGTLFGLFLVIFCFFWVLSFQPGCGACSASLPVEAAQKVVATCVDPTVTGADYEKACPAAKVELAKLVLTDPNVAAYRQFWKSMFDPIVGTTLLPIVTALLGYLFASNNRGAPPKPNDAGSAQ
jgi:hypothetical protein